MDDDYICDYRNRSLLDMCHDNRWYCCRVRICVFWRTEHHPSSVGNLVGTRPSEQTGTRCDNTRHTEIQRMNETISSTDFSRQFCTYGWVSQLRTSPSTHTHTHKYISLHSRAYIGPRRMCMYETLTSLSSTIEGEPDP